MKDMGVERQKKRRSETISRRTTRILNQSLSLLNKGSENAGRTIVKLVSSASAATFGPRQIELTAEFLEESAPLTRLTRAMELLDELVQDEDWQSVDALIGEWDRTREATEAGERLYISAVREMAYILSGSWYRRNSLIPAPPPAPSEEALYRMERICDENPDCCHLAITTAYLFGLKVFELCYADHPITEGRLPKLAIEKARPYIIRGKRLAAPCRDLIENSPLLELVEIGWLFAEMDDDTDLFAAFRKFQSADPTSALSYQWYGSMLLRQKRAASVGRIHKVLSKELDRFGPLHGPAAYSWAWLWIARQDPSLLHGLDIDTFDEGLDTIVTLNGRHPAFVGQLVRGLMELRKGMPAKPARSKTAIPSLVSEKDGPCKQDRLRNSAKLLARRHLTAIDIVTWGSRERALNCLRDMFAEDLAACQSYVMTKGGITKAPVKSKA